MAIKDAYLQFTTVGTPFVPTAVQDNVAPNTYDTSPLGLPTGSGGAGSLGYNAGVSVNAGRDLGIGGEMWLEVLVTTSVTQTSGGVIFSLATDSTATLTTVNKLVSSPNLSAATLVAQYRWLVQLPSSLLYQQYLGFVVTPVTNVLSGGGAFEAKLLMNIQQSEFYLSGYNVQ